MLAEREEAHRHPATKESAEAFPVEAHPEVAEEARRHPSTGVSLQPSPARSVHQTATHQDHRLAHPSNQEAEARPEVTKARRPAFRHPEMATEMAPAHHQAFLLDAGACKLIQGHFRDDLHHHPEASAHRQRILERPEEVVEARHPEVALEAHRHRPEVAVEARRHRVLHRVEVAAKLHAHHWHTGRYNPEDSYCHIGQASTNLASVHHPEEVEARPEATKAHPDSEDLEVVVVAYREFRGVAHRPTAEVAV